MPSFPSKIILAVAGIVLLVFFVYTPALENGFVNWDDDVHSTRNQFIRSLDFRHIKEIFTTTVNKIYIPLTTLSFAVERHFFGLDPFVYHLNNILLHIFVTICVFMFSFHCGLSLSGATIAALIFGVHPMHVESVAWVTERKDVLYASFFMLSLLSYSHYIKTGCEKIRYFLFTMVLGFLSVLAKPMALSLPMVLFVLDWFYRRKISVASLIEKALVAFLLAPVVWVTYQAHARMLELVFPRSLLLWIWNLTFYLK